MDDILQGLNGEQRQAVLHDHALHGPVLVLAGAGSGKTSVLTRRMQWRIAQGVAPEKMLALTFTAEAAAEMGERLRALFPSALTRLCTFHSLALHILRATVNDIDNWQRSGFACAPVPAEEGQGSWADFLADCGWSGKPLPRGDLFCPNGCDAKRTAMLGRLRTPVLTSGKVLFDDLVWLAIALLEGHDEVRRWAHDCWSEILVDEYQDIDPVQYRMVRALLGERSALFVVGDDDQAIYGFRGADIGNILRFRADFPQARLIRLEWNYRSTSQVLCVANRIFADKPLNLAKTLRPGAQRGYALFRENRPPEIWHSRQAVDEINRLVYHMRSLRADYALEWHDLAVLARYNRQCLYYIMALRERGLPVCSDGDDGDADGIRIMTVHASKGLQFPVVYYVGLARGLTPGEGRGGRAQRRLQSEEEKRLFYVGVTRAEALLVLLFCRHRHWRGKLLNFKPSPFLRWCSCETSASRLPMPVILFKIFAVTRVLWYMAMRMPSYAWTRMRDKSAVPGWINRKAMEWSRLCMRSLRLDLHLENPGKLAAVDWNRPVIVVSNHESYADIPVVLLAVERILGFLAKKELGYIPFLAYWMRQIGCLFIDRSKKGAGGEVSQKIGGAGASTRIVIFPEGTRSKDGKLGVFKSGAFRLALELDAVIVPIVHAGTRTGWENRKDSRVIQNVRAQVLEPVDVVELKKTLGRDIQVKSDLMPFVQQAMLTARAELETKL